MSGSRKSEQEHVPRFSIESENQEVSGRFTLTCWQKFGTLILQNIRTSLAKENQQVLICGVRLHFHKHFDQKSSYNMGNY